MVKYLYVLTSNENDFYYEQALLSIMSLRVHNPNAHIALLIDNLTFETLKDRRKKVLELVQEYKVIEFSDDLSFKVRSRMLKTNMRNHIDGDFLYIDCDTVIVETLNIPQDWYFDIGAVKHIHFSELSKSPSYHSFKFNTDKCDIPLNSEDYFNGGVLYVKDNFETRKFFFHWNTLYIKYLNSQSIDIDQLSLYEANSDFGGIIKELPGEWNWQVGFGLNYFNNAKIMHILTTAYIQSEREINSVHLLQRRHIYQNIKSQIYTESDILQLIKNAKTSFDENIKITPMGFDMDYMNKSIVDFCKKNKYIFFLGETGFDQIVFSVIKQCNVKISGVIVQAKKNENQNMMNIPIYSIDELPFNPQEIGVLVAIKFPYVNQALPVLISNKIFNILFLF